MLREVAEDLKFLVTRKEKTIRLPTCWVKSGIVTFAKNGKNYTLAGKSCHKKTNKHIKNNRSSNIMNKIIDINT